jgi:prevent-host-death family protein
MTTTMRKVNIHEAKTTLSQLIEAVESGERVVLARAGKPVAELVRVRGRPRGIRLGTLRGRIPDRLLREAAEPLTAREVDALFGLRIEP